MHWIGRCIKNTCQEITRTNNCIGSGSRKLPCADWRAVHLCRTGSGWNWKRSVCSRKYPIPIFLTRDYWKITNLFYQKFYPSEYYTTWCFPSFRDLPDIVFPVDRDELVASVVIRAPKKVQRGHRATNLHFCGQGIDNLCNQLFGFLFTFYRPSKHLRITLKDTLNLLGWIT